MKSRGRKHMRRWRMLPGLILGAALLWPTVSEAQRRGNDWRRPNPWSFSPYGGVIRDAYDISPDGKDTGWLVGFRLGYDLTGRARLTGNVGYSESDDVTSGPLTSARVILDNEYIITAGGLEYDILPGNTSVTLGTEAGGLWRKVAFDRQLGGGTVNPNPGDDGYAFYFVIVPGLTIRHGFTPRTALEVGVRDFMHPDEEMEHLPALTLGFRFR
jgi:hypothetical protein